MPTLPDDPLRRVTLNLYEADVIEMIRIHGTGWTVRVREMVHSRVADLKAPPIKTRIKLGDLT